METEAAQEASGECIPTALADSFEQFLDDVSSREQRAALAAIAPRRLLQRVTIFHGTRPGEGRVDAETPQAVFKSFAETIPAGEKAMLLVAAVGGDAPFSEVYESLPGGTEAAGVEFVARIGSRVLSGKVGLGCVDGRLYVGAMQASARLRPVQMCGRYVRLGMESPVVCRI